MKNSTETQVQVILNEYISKLRNVENLPGYDNEDPHSKKDKEFCSKMADEMQTLLDDLTE